MQKLEINNFGPIDHCSIQVNDFMVFIGPQSSGKSVSFPEFQTGEK